MGGASRDGGDRVKRVRRAALVIRDPSGYGPAADGISTRHPRSGIVSLRLLLALWATAIYAVYWFGYLRGAL
jgi:hypothetical protein